LKKSIKRRVIWVAATAVLVTALATTGGLIARQRARADSSPAADQVATAFVGSLSAQASASGQLRPQREAALSFPSPGKVQEVFVSVGDVVNAGSPLAQLEDDALERALRNAQQTLAVREANLSELRTGARAEELAVAEAAVASARTQLADLLAGAREEDLLAAQASVASARAQLDDLAAGPTDEELARARTALASARASLAVEGERLAARDAQITVARQQLDVAAIQLESARYFYDALKNDWQHKDYADYSPEAEALADAQAAYDVALARYNLSLANINDTAYRNAQAQVAQANVSLRALTEDKTVEVAAAREQLAQAELALSRLTDERRVQVANARSQLAQAETNLASLVEGPSQEELAIAQAQVEQARISVSTAQARLDEASLRAPFDGTVTIVHVAVGGWASGPAVEVVDTGSLEVVLDVDEVDVGQLSIGTQTFVTLEAWPERELQGEVVAIAPRGSASSEIVTYEVHIRLATPDLPLRTGMTANAQLVTMARSDVLLVPNRAITVDRQAAKYYVYQVDGQDLRKTEVTIGLRDSEYTEVRSGLAKGDRVALNYEESGFPFGPPSASR
jgi:HlyD family secretion protein